MKLLAPLHRTLGLNLGLSLGLLPMLCHGQGQAEILPLPLSGPAYAIANEAYGAYNRKDYDLAIAKAREALEQSNTPIDRIAWEVGYSDVAAFRKSFQKLTGMPPSAYRQTFGIAPATA